MEKDSRTGLAPCSRRQKKGVNGYVEREQARKSACRSSLILLTYVMAIFGVLAVTVATYSADSETEKTLLNQIVGSLYGSRQAIFLLISPIILGVVTYFRYESLRLLSVFFTISACSCCFWFL
jgi:type IV secretory pathway VirB2 component (pilin)